MLLAIDAGNTQTVIGLFDGTTLADHWRIATVAERTADELALMIQQFLAFHGFRGFVVDPPAGSTPAPDAGPPAASPISGVVISSGVPRVTAELREMTDRYFGFAALVLEPGVRTGMPILYDNPKEVGARPDRQRGRRLRAVRRPVDRRRLRDREHHRGDQRAGRVPRRGDLPRHRDLDGRPVRAGRRAAAGRAGRPPARDRQVHRRVDPVGLRVRLQRPGRRARRPVSGRARATARSSPPAGSPTRSSPTPAPCSTTSRGSPSRGCGSSSSATGDRAPDLDGTARRWLTTATSGRSASGASPSSTRSAPPGPTRTRCGSTGPTPRPRSTSTGTTSSPARRPTTWSASPAGCCSSAGRASSPSPRCGTAPPACSSSSRTRSSAVRSTRRSTSSTSATGSAPRAR